MSYENLAGFAQSIGLIYFIAMFLAVVWYAFSPKNKTRFDAAASMPLNEDQTHG
jgi:cytochrome c oxidase cbb3-type subunit IV